MKAACAQKQGAEDDDDGDDDDDDHDMTAMTVILTVDHARRTLQVVPLRGLDSAFSQTPAHYNKPIPPSRTAATLPRVANEVVSVPRRLYGHSCSPSLAKQKMGRRCGACGHCSPPPSHDHHHHH